MASLIHEPTNRKPEYQKINQPIPVSMKQILLFLLLSLTLLFTSCFDIVEEIFLEKDGSGQMQITVDLSDMMQMISLFMADSLRANLNLDHWHEDLKQDLALYNRVKGISEVKSEQKEAYVYEISFRFANLPALQQAMAVQKDMGGATDTLNIPQMARQQTPNFIFNAKKGVLKRQTKIRDFMADNQSFDINSNKSFLQLMNSPTYQIIYHLPKSIKDISSTTTVTQTTKKGKTAKVTYNLFDLMAEEQLQLEHEIRF